MKDSFHSESESPKSDYILPPTVNQCELDFGILIQGKRKMLSQIVSNPGHYPLLWSANKEEVSWLKVEPSVGVLQPGEKQIIQVIVETSGLAEDSYLATIHFSTEADEASVSVPVAVRFVVVPFQLI